jgi:glycosyltransferase involved in cell wall biosynthesis
MSDKSPQISVLMPVYNAERYLREAVESILNQSFTDFEFLIVNDGSTDGSLSILEEYAAKDDRIRLINRPNTGYVVALNEMLELSQGEFIARMDADDVATPERFELQLLFMESHPEVACVGGQILLIDPCGNPLVHFLHPLTHEDIDTAHLSGSTAIAHPTALIRREALLAVQGYRVEYYTAEDIDLFLRLAEIGRLANLPQMILRYRQLVSSISYSRRRQQADSAWRATRAAADRRGLSFDVRPPDPNAATESSSEIAARWAWWALAAGNLSTARHHALRALISHPLRLSNWRLAACALRGR